MKKILFLFITLLSFMKITAQETYVPDDNFEAYLEANSMGNGIANDNHVSTTNISGVTQLNVSNQNISDLTGIEDFAALTNLNCHDNNLTSLDVSQNSQLERLYAYNNALMILNTQGLSSLKTLSAFNNQLSQLDIVSNTALNLFFVNNNLLTEIDISAHSGIYQINFSNNQLQRLNVKNGMNAYYTTFDATNNPDLTCVQVDDAAYMAANWPDAIDANASYNEDCHYGLTYVPDDNFENYLETHDAAGNYVALGDTNSMGNGIDNDDYVSTSNISSVTHLDVHQKNIYDLIGIEDFSALTHLNCSINHLTSIDLSHNVNLYELQINSNTLTNLDVSQNTQLTYIDMGYNHIAQIDLSNTTAMETLSASNNYLVDLDVSMLPVFVSLDVTNNHLIALNVKNGNNTNFTRFLATSNPDLTCIQVDDATWSTTNWTDIDATASYSENCYYDQTYVPDDNFENYLETHDVTGNPVALGDATSLGNGMMDDYVPTVKIDTLTDLYIGNQNIVDLTGIEDFVGLQMLYCEYNQLTNLDLSSNTNLLGIDCKHNLFTDIILTQNTHLGYIDCSDNPLTALDISNNPELATLWCYNTDISSLDVSQNPNLLSLNCANCALDSLDVTHNTLLYTLTAHANAISSIDLSQNTVLVTALLGDNKLKGLDVTHNPNLEFLSIAGNHFLSIDLSQNPALQKLYCWDNILASLDVSHNHNLKNLGCGENPLTWLYLDDNPNLEIVQCMNSNLTELHLQNGANNLLAGTIQFNQEAHGRVVVTGNPNLTCIYVDDATAANNSTGYYQYWEKDVTATYIENSSECMPQATTYVPDDNFENYLETHNAAGNTVSMGYEFSLGNGVMDNEVPTAKIHNLTDLDIHSQNIADLTGIEDFVGLQNLQCAINQLTTIDVSNNPALNVFQCNDNLLSVLDVTQNAALTYLVCDTNQLSNIDVSQNANLASLYCSNNSITNLNVTQNPYLYNIDCHNTNISALDLSQNTALFNLVCYNCNLSALDLSLNTKLRWVLAYNNQITSININHNPELENLFLCQNQLTALEVSQDSNLRWLCLGSNQISSIDVSQNTALQKLWCNDNQLTSLNVRDNIDLQELSCGDNQLSSLDISHNTNLRYLYTQNNQLTSLDVDSNPLLEELWCQDNQLTELHIQNGANNLLSGTFTSGDNTYARMRATNNPNLTCIYVDDATSANNGTGDYQDWEIDATTTYVSNASECQALSYEDYNQIENLNLVPNPAIDTFSILTDALVQKVRIFDYTGRKVAEFAPQQNYDISTLQSSVYFVVVTTEKGTGTKRLVIR